MTGGPRLHRQSLLRLRVPAGRGRPGITGVGVLQHQLRAAGLRELRRARTPGPGGRPAHRAQNPCTAYNYGWNAAADAVDRARRRGHRAGDVVARRRDRQLLGGLPRPRPQRPGHPGGARPAPVARAERRACTRSARCGHGSPAAATAPGCRSGTRRPSRDRPPSAPHYCDPAYGFTGGAVWLVQWTDSVDHDYACGAARAAEPPAAADRLPAEAAADLPAPRPAAAGAAPPGALRGERGWRRYASARPSGSGGPARG